MEIETLSLRQRIGTAVRYFRLKQGLSLADVAAATGCGDPNRIARIEAGDGADLLVEELGHLATALNAPVNALINGTFGSHEANMASTDNQIQDRLVADTVDLLRVLKAEGRLTLSEDLFEPYAQAVAERALAKRRG